MDNDNIGHWIEVEVPHMLQEHGARDHPASITCQIFERFKRAWQQFDLVSVLAAVRQGDPIPISPTQWRLVTAVALRRASGSTRANISRNANGFARFDVTTTAQSADVIINFTERARDQCGGAHPFLVQQPNYWDPIDSREYAIHGDDDIMRGQTATEPLSPSIVNSTS